jgi:predicted lipid-binding transport protein (Tim44 family)
MAEQIIGLFTTQADAEAARSRLEQAGLAPEQIMVDRQPAQTVARQVPVDETKALSNGMKGGLTGGILGSLLAFVFAILVNSAASEANATPHVSTFLLALGGGLIGAIAMGILASFTGANVVAPDRNQPEPEAVHAVKMTGTQEQFVEATRIIQNGG